VVTLIAIAALLSPAVAGAQGANPIVVENQKQGSTGWRLERAGFAVANDTAKQIKGYASRTSVGKGGSITFHVTVRPAQSYTIDIYRIGWYQGRGGRLMRHVGPLRGSRQPSCPADSTSGLIECDWSPSYALRVPKAWTTGVYLALLTNARRFQNYVVFVVRDDRRVADLLYQQSVTTYQAYNNYPNDERTGKSLYDEGGGRSYGQDTVAGAKRAVRVSFDRPYKDDGGGQFLVWEYYLVRWLERSGYDVSYTTDIDTHENPQRLLSYRGFLAVGHDEYWSKEMYDGVDAARNAGVNLAFLGANIDYWQIRFEPSPLTGAANRTIVCYKKRPLDPVQGPTTTVTWESSYLNRSEQRLIGVQSTTYILPDSPHFPYVVTDSEHWIFAGTGFADGASVPGIVGYETDRFSPEYGEPEAVPGTYTLLSRSPIVDWSGASDYSNSSIYQAPSGAWVFAAGTIAWSWGLAKPGVANPRIQRMTANLLDRFVKG
jgi:hypothetical protein